MSDTKYELYVHHNYGNEDSRKIGHFYVEIRKSEQNAKSESKFYGKNPATKGRAVSHGHIKDEETRHNDRKEYSTPITKDLALTESEYNSALQFIENEQKNPGKYFGGVDDCIKFTDGVYKATGQDGHFTIL